MCWTLTNLHLGAALHASGGLTTDSHVLAHPSVTIRVSFAAAFSPTCSCFRTRPRSPSLSAACSAGCPCRFRFLVVYVVLFASSRGAHYASLPWRAATSLRWPSVGTASVFTAIWCPLVSARAFPSSSPGFHVDVPLLSAGRRGAPTSTRVGSPRFRSVGVPVLLGAAGTLSWSPPRVCPVFLFRPCLRPWRSSPPRFVYPAASFSFDPPGAQQLRQPVNPAGASSALHGCWIGHGYLLDLGRSPRLTFRRCVYICWRDAGVTS